MQFTGALDLFHQKIKRGSKFDVVSLGACALENRSQDATASDWHSLRGRR